MKLLHFLIFIFVINFSCSQNKGLGYLAPPNGIYLYDSIYIDKTEIANLDWLEFLFDIKKDSSRDYFLKNLPDTTVWRKVIGNEPREHYYFRHPGYRYFPVVGITYEQALNYCKWRSDIVSERINKVIKNSKNHELNNYIVRLEWRLPTENDWEYIAQGKLNKNQYSHGYKNIYTKVKLKRSSAKDYYASTKLYKLYKYDSTKTYKEFKSDFKYYIKNDSILKFNCNIDRPYFLKNDSLYPNWVYYNEPNSIGIYNIIGNVSEMVSEKGIAKGGSFFHSINECKIQARQYYDKPEAWLGFRCLCEVKLNKITRK